jgi:hypothetical protein
MQEAATTDVDSEELRPGKGYRTPLTSRYINWLKAVTAELEEAWDAGDSAQEVFAALPWGDREGEHEGSVSSPKFGDAKWTGIQVREDQIRISMQLDPKGRLSLDYREWYQAH